MSLASASVASLYSTSSIAISSLGSVAQSILSSQVYPGHLPTRTALTRSLFLLERRIYSFSVICHTRRDGRSFATIEVRYISYRHHALLVKLIVHKLLFQPTRANIPLANPRHSRRHNRRRLRPRGSCYRHRSHHPRTSKTTSTHRQPQPPAPWRPAPAKLPNVGSSAVPAGPTRAARATPAGLALG